jgi:hypothetical protein
MYIRGLRQFCSVLGGEPQGYVDVSRLAKAEMDKIGKIQGRQNGVNLETKSPCGQSRMARMPESAN